MNLKKLMLAVFFMGTFAVLESNAQELGLRFGNVNGNNVALDGVFSLGEFSRVHGDLSFGGGGVGLDLLWNPIYRPIPDTEFNYYLGFGPSVFLGEPFLLGAAGEIGAEYQFPDIPLIVGLDWRPYFMLVETTFFDAGGFGLNVRWRLN
ncbi:outer membrane insertion C- signal [Algoriphagus hitonicola]|nr:outer membrane insertion C- signal [Algoriphagus hitonicola]